MGSQHLTQSALYMDTVVSLKVVTACAAAEVEPQLARAFAAFRFVEQTCSRFSADSEVMQLVQQVGTPVRVSDLLFEAVRFALQVAELTDGAFDPTVGQQLERHGFNQHYLTGQRIETPLDPQVSVSYRDVVVDEAQRTILLQKPLILDLGAVAKGLAVDLAARELREFAGFLVDAGGDIYAGGLNERGERWRVGIRHPQRREETICTLQLTEVAVCTSGSYERVSPYDADTHHLLDPQAGRAQKELVSCTVVAPFAMMADAFSTAAFVLGAEKGTAWLEAADVAGLLITPPLQQVQTNEMKRYMA